MSDKQEQLVEEPVYITKLEVQGVNCFKGKYVIDFTDEEGKPSMWTVLLGNNNTGKTTLLRIIAALGANDNPSQVTFDKDEKIEVYFNNVSMLETSDYFSSIERNSSDINNEIDQGLLLTNKGEESLFTIFSDSSMTLTSVYERIIIDAYGTQRKRGKGSHIEYDLKDRVESIFNDSLDNIINAEEWFLGTKFEALLDNKKASNQLDKVKEALITLLPDIKDIQVGSAEKRRVYFITNNDDKVLINQLGSGYQSLITWVVDYAKRQFDRYPESENPLAEPGIVLVDEIDLHLHPTWQRKVVDFLRGLFPKTQFIVTAHSPLVVQSADDMNVVVLHRDEDTDEIRIDQPELTNFQGWSVEEILQDLMEAQVYSNEYLDLRKKFTLAIQEDDYETAKKTFEALKDIIHPRSSQIELMKLQMTSLSYD